MQTFLRFDPVAFLENSISTEPAAKVANPAKEPEPGPTGGRTLAAFAALAGRGGRSENSAWPRDYQERAAIVEFDAGVPRDWAEAFAHLDPDRPPADVPVKRWQQFVDDCGRFLDGQWPARAAALGWQPVDLFGCDRRKPFHRIDRQGLLWLLDGRELLAMTEDGAVIECEDGVRQTYRRRRGQPGRVLPWELEP